MSIELIMESIAEKQVATDDTVLINILRQVVLLLDQSNNGMDVDKLQQALTYLGSMPIQKKGQATFFKSAPLIPGKLINELERDKSRKAYYDEAQLEQMRKKLGDKVYSPPLNMVLSNDAKAVLSELYWSVQEQLPFWHYDYPLGAFDDYLATGWDVKQNQALEKDFTRNAKIEGELGGDMKAAAARIDQYVDRSQGYSDEAKRNIAQWIKNNGGQAMAAFAVAHAVSLAGHFGEGMVTTATTDMTDWKMVNGQPTADILIVISALQVFVPPSAKYPSGVKYLVAQEDGTVKEVANPESISLGDKSKPVGSSIPKLLVFKAQVKLDVDKDNRVSPVMTSCGVSCYSNQLKLSARLFPEPGKSPPRTGKFTNG